MKNTFYTAGRSVLLLVLVVSFVGCGAKPKTLAKQSYDLRQEALGALSTSNPLKIAQVALKAANISKKVAKLSGRDRALYNEEIANLTGGAGLLGLSALLNGADAGGLSDVTRQIVEILSSLEAGGVSGENAPPN